jgi:hypothetical protein
MTQITRLVRAAALLWIAAAASSPVNAHSASDAYLTIVEQPRAGSANALSVIHAQWDIALRDLDFVLKLDDNGDGKIVWGELRKHQQAVAQYASRYLDVSANGQLCRSTPTGQLVDAHADGAYASLMFDVVCAGRPRGLTLDYRLFFAIDPSHRAIVVFRNGDNVATALMTSEKTRIDLPL